MLIRSLHRAGSESLRLTLYYRADPSGLDDARLTGVVRPLPDDPAAVIVVFPGINVDPGSYRSLASALAGAGHVVAVCSLIADLGPVGSGISPGIDMAMLTPEALGAGPSAHALSEVLDLIAADPLLGRCVDMDRVALGGHSAGGTLALHNARPDWFRGVRCAFAYAGHTVLAAGMGHRSGAVLPVPEMTPTLLVAGARDGVIAESRDRYATPDDHSSTAAKSDASGHGSGGGVPDGLGGRGASRSQRHDPVRRTFDEAITSNRGDCWWVELADGTHFTPCCPLDETSGRSFLDPAGAPRQNEARELLTDLIVAFVAEHLSGEPSTMEHVLQRQGVAAWVRR